MHIILCMHESMMINWEAGATLKVLLHHFNGRVRYLEIFFFLAYQISCCLFLFDGNIVCKVQCCHEGSYHSIFHFGTHLDKSIIGLSGGGKLRAIVVGKDCDFRSCINVNALTALMGAILCIFLAFRPVLFLKRMDLMVN
jgi:hypothetical protein